MPYRFTDRSESVTMETNETGELICKLCDGSRAFVTIVKEITGRMVSEDDLKSLDMNSVEDINAIEQLTDIGAHTANYIFKLWRLGAMSFVFNKEADLLLHPISPLGREVLLEARAGQLCYETMRTLIADELSFAMISAKRRGQEESVAEIGEMLLGEVKGLLEEGLLLPRFEG